MNIPNINFKDIYINLKDAYKYIKEDSLFLTHDEFVSFCGDTKYKGTMRLTGDIYVLETNDNKSYFIEGQNDCSYILDSEGTGSIIVTGPNKCNAIRDGVGLGDAIRVGDGAGDATRIYYNPKLEFNDITNVFIGSAIRDGGGYGSAVFFSFYAGNALRLGSGKGTAYKYESSKAGFQYSQSDNSIDILSIPKHLIKKDENILAKIISYENFLSRTTYESDTYWIESNGDNLIIETDKNDSVSSIGMRGDLPGSIELRINFFISNSAMVTRAGIGEGHAIISGKGHGNVIKVGEGSGHALSIGEIMGTARKIGKGAGEAFKENLNLGGAITLRSDDKIDTY